jgi:hypothetical protein
MGHHLVCRFLGATIGGQIHITLWRLRWKLANFSVMLNTVEWILSQIDMPWLMCMREIEGFHDDPWDQSGRGWSQMAMSQSPSPRP